MQPVKGASKDQSLLTYAFSFITSRVPTLFGRKVQQKQRDMNEAYDGARHIAKIAEENEVIEGCELVRRGEILGTMLAKAGNNIRNLRSHPDSHWNTERYSQERLTCKGKITDDQVRKLMNFFCNIRHFTLEGEAVCHLSQFAASLTKPKTLHIRNPQDSSMHLNNDLLAFANQHPTLTALHLTGFQHEVTPEGLGNVLAVLKDIKTLGLRDSHLLCKSVFQRLVDSNPPIETLDIRGLDFYNFSKLEAQALCSLLSQITKLQKVHVTRSFLGCCSSYNVFKKTFAQDCHRIELVEHEDSLRTKVVRGAGLVLGLALSVLVPLAVDHYTSPYVNARKV